MARRALPPCALASGVPKVAGRCDHGGEVMGESAGRAAIRARSDECWWWGPAPAAARSARSISTNWVWSTPPSPADKGRGPARARAWVLWRLRGRREPPLGTGKRVNRWHAVAQYRRDERARGNCGTNAATASRILRRRRELVDETMRVSRRSRARRYPRAPMPPKRRVPSRSYNVQAVKVRPLPGTISTRVFQPAHPARIHWLVVIAAISVVDAARAWRRSASQTRSPRCSAGMVNEVVVLVVRHLGTVGSKEARRARAWKAAPSARVEGDHRGEVRACGRRRLPWPRGGGRAMLEETWRSPTTACAAVAGRCVVPADCALAVDGAPFLRRAWWSRRRRGPGAGSCGNGCRGVLRWAGQSGRGAGPARPLLCGADR